MVVQIASIKINLPHLTWTDHFIKSKKDKKQPMTWTAVLCKQHLKAKKEMMKLRLAILCIQDSGCFLRGQGHFEFLISESPRQMLEVESERHASFV